MTTRLNELNAQHQVLLDWVQEAEGSEAVPKIENFLEELAQAGLETVNARQRSQLRGIIRFWSSFIYDRTGQFPEVQLLPASTTGEPLAISQAEIEEPAKSQPELMAKIKQIGPYELIEEIGKGGFSEVYKAVDTLTEQLVALKVLQGEQFQHSRRFKERLIERERLVAELDHPHIIPVYSVTEYNGIPCIVMKYIESGSLDDRLAHWYWRPSVQTILEIVRQATEGLAYLHNRQIIHRDIKPANILLSFDDQAYLTDFGIAQVFESALKGMVVGTPEYLAPEAILRPSSVDGRVDLYSLGVILFELFVGKPPFSAESATEVLHLQVNQPVPRFDKEEGFSSFSKKIAVTIHKYLGKDSDKHEEDAFFVSKRIAAMIYKCLEKDPDKRFQDAEEMLGEIEQLLSSLPDTVLDACPPHFTTAPETRYVRHGTQPLSEVDLPTSPPAQTPAPPPPVAAVGGTCPQCGHPFMPGEAFCDNCGAALPARSPAPPPQPTPGWGGQTCPNCGMQVEPGAAFCDNCGSSVTSLSPRSPTRPLTGEMLSPSRPPLYPPVQPSSNQSDTLILEESKHLVYQGVLAILIFRSDTPGENHFVVRQNRTTIGRGQYNDIVINEPSLSRQHALLVYEKPEDKAGMFTLYDLASANGTFINNKDRVCVKCKLKHNDSIRLGQVELLFKRLDDDPKPLSTKKDESQTEQSNGLAGNSIETD